MTLRRRSPKLLAEIANTPSSAWEKIELDVPHRKYKTPRVVEKQTHLKGCKKPFRQFYIKDLGHDVPTILLTNDPNPSTRQLITRYAQRMVIENGLAESIEFFHLDALSSTISLKVDFDVLLTIIAGGLYRDLARRLRGYEHVQAAQIFRHFLDTPGEVEVTQDSAVVTLPKRAHLPLLIQAGLLNEETPVPWWSGKTLKFRHA